MDVAAQALLAATSGGANSDESRLDSAAPQMGAGLEPDQEAVPGAPVSEEHPAGMGGASFAVRHGSMASSCYPYKYPLHLGPCVHPYIPACHHSVQRFYISLHNPRLRYCAGA